MAEADIEPKPYVRFMSVTPAERRKPGIDLHPGERVVTALPASMRSAVGTIILVIAYEPST